MKYLIILALIVLFVWHEHNVNYGYGNIIMEGKYEGCKYSKHW